MGKTWKFPLPKTEMRLFELLTKCHVPLTRLCSPESCPKAPFTWAGVTQSGVNKSGYFQFLQEPHKDAKACSRDLSVHDLSSPPMILDTCGTVWLLPAGGEGGSTYNRRCTCCRRASRRVFKKSRVFFSCGKHGYSNAMYTICVNTCWWHQHFPKSLKYMWGR